MFQRVAVLLISAFALCSVDGFSIAPTKASSLLPNGAPGVSPSARPFRTNINTGPRSPFPALSMSDMPYGEIVQEPTAPVQVADATMADMAEIALIESTTSAQNFGDQVLQKIRSIDINEVVNTSIVIALAVAVIYKLTMVDAGLTRGWTAEEVAERMAADNWSQYLHVLRSNPIATKAVTSATVYAIGDTIAQRTEGESMGSLDRPRIIRSALAGLIGHGPMSHFWYQISENFFDNVLQFTAWWSFIPKVAVDQTVWGPIWNNSYIILIGLMKLQSPGTIWGDMKRTTIPLILSGLKLWPLAHCVTYGLIPVENRLLWVDMVEIVWVTILATQAAGAEKAGAHGALDSEEQSKPER